MNNLIKEFMTCFNFEFKNHIGEKYIIESMSKNNVFNFELFSACFINEIENINYPWVEHAIETKFVEKKNPFGQTDRLDIDDIVIFIDSNMWEYSVKQDACLSIEQKNILKNDIKNLNTIKYKNILSLLREPSFDWVPFEVKNKLIITFDDWSYANADIIYYIKTIIWDFLFPAYFEKSRLSSIAIDAENIIQKKIKNQGWVELTTIVSELEECYPKIDAFEVKKACNSTYYQYTGHFKNVYSPGFIRYQRI